MVLSALRISVVILRPSSFDTLRHPSTTLRQAQDDIAQDDIAQDDVAQDDIAQDDIAQGDVAQDDVAQDDIGQNDVAQDDNHGDTECIERHRDCFRAGAMTNGNRSIY